jgi:hypothetical protein
MTMAGSTTRPRRGRLAVALVFPGLWAIALLVTGAMNTAQPWGLVCLGTGIASALVIGAAAATGAWLLAVFGSLLIAAAGLVAAGAIVSEATLIGGGVLGLVVVGAAAPMCVLLRDLRSAPATSSASEVGRLEPLLQRIHENSMLSDNAKRILFREREIGLLREAIEVDLSEGKYNVALTLCDEMADVFGYREEAEAFRTRILQSRQERFDMEVRAALAHLDELLVRRDWGAVHREAARIRRLYGDSHLVQDLDQRILNAREEHKKELEGSFLKAAERDDVEGAMRILRQLDRYLGQDEAARLAEVAQGVVARHRENLGVQFKLAVNDRRWAEAARIGEVLIEEFPNTKMADEVRSMIDLIRTRATQAAVSSARP